MSSEQPVHPGGAAVCLLGRGLSPGGLAEALSLQGRLHHLLPQVRQAYLHPHHPALSSVGVVSQCEDVGVGAAYARLTGWSNVVREMHVQEEALALHSLVMDGLTRDTGKKKKKEKERNTGKTIKQVLDGDCVLTERALEGRLPCVTVSGVCVLSLQWLEVAGGSELTQIGAVFVEAQEMSMGNKGFKTESFFSAVLPASASQDQAMFSGLGLSRALATGAVQLSLPTSSVTVVSELQALLSLFHFLRQHLTSPSCLLVTLSSHTSLPLLLHAVARHGLESQFYLLFSAFTDLHSLALELQVGRG